MPSTRRQKAKARRSREADIMSDIENMDVLIGNPNLTENRLDFDITSERSNSNARGSQSQENEIRTASDNTNELRNELNLRISQEMDSLMFSVNSQIQRTINEAINSQILPQIQNSIRQVQGSNANNRDVHAERPEHRSGDVAEKQAHGPSLFQKDTLQDNRGECHYTELQRSVTHPVNFSKF